MAFDYSGTVSQIAAAINTYGAPITLSRDGVATGKTYAVFDEDKKIMDSSNSISSAGLLIVGSVVAYISAQKKPPQVGDALTGPDRSYRITEVEKYKPATTVIAYKLTLE